MRENRLSGSMQGRREETKGTGNFGLFNPYMPSPAYSTALKLEQTRTSPISSYLCTFFLKKLKFPRPSDFSDGLLAQACSADSVRWVRL